MSVGYFEQKDTICPNCGKSIYCKVWLVVDGTECPELLERIRAGSIHTISCSSCNDSFQINEPLFLYRASNTPFLVFSPSEDSPKEDYAAQRNKLAARLPKVIETRLNSLSAIEKTPIIERPFLPFISITLHEATKLLASLSQLLRSDTLELAQRVIEQRPDLLTRDMFIVLDGNISGARARGDKPYERNLSDYRSVLLRCREVGISKTFDELVKGTGPVAVPFHQILFRLLEARTNKEAMLIADTYPVLLTEESLTIFQDYIAQAEADNNEDAVADFRDGLILLHDLRRTASGLSSPIGAYSRMPQETNHFIPHGNKPATVSSPYFDEGILRAERKSATEVSVFSFADLLNKLNSDDNPHYVYRGAKPDF